MTIVSRTQVVYLLFWTIMGTGILVMPTGIAHFTINDGWICASLTSIGLLITVIIAYAYSRTFENVNLAKSFKLAFGPIVGALVGIWYLIWLFVAICIIWREFNLFLEGTVYPKTALVVLAAALVIPISFGALHGLESLGRTAQFFAPLMFLGTVIPILLSLRYADFSQLSPSIADGWIPIFRGAILPNTTFMLQLIVILQVYTNLSQPKKIAVDVFLAGILIVVLSVIIEIISISVLGRNISYVTYTLLSVVRSIYLGEFVQRFDTLYIMGLLTTVYLKLTFYIYLTSLAITEVFNVTSYKTSVISLTIACWAGAILLIKDGTALSHYNLSTTPAYYIFTAIIIPCTTILVFRIRRRLATGPGP
ncbi:GerAB/ArcD/ProY family transporter [Alicyclobacillus sp. SO9]|uniref:GerAB/ArcD/ProY family transporter n=1 Tax=Alicyclobacillus sp. SO9 TaxID=2665646 RepID=UPI0018E84ABE|nr:GerAB/ArcD/ProY family transporter [Alicyclobacillus sp. SO9]QQE80961.1 GerAB/ArcD/ProY family transporter [Alicyclobacillus sp. SO9]